MIIGGTFIQAVGTNAFLVALALTVSNAWIKMSRSMIEALGRALARPAIEGAFVVVNLYLFLAFLLHLRRLRIACRKNGLTLDELAALTRSRQKDILRRPAS